MYRHYGDGILRENGEIAEFDIWADSYEVEEFYTSLLEMGDGIWAGDINQEPSETAKESVSSHQKTKTIKKSNKKKSMEQRSKQKKSNRIDVIPDIEELDWE